VTGTSACAGSMYIPPRLTLTRANFDGAAFDLQLVALANPALLGVALAFVGDGDGDGGEAERRQEVAEEAGEIEEKEGGKEEEEDDEEGRDDDADDDADDDGGVEGLQPERWWTGIYLSLEDILI
jgi:hypothetical protein